MCIAKRIVLVGPPGSKRKEIALWLSETLVEETGGKFECISVGDLINKEISKSLHESGIATFGIGSSRASSVELAQAVADASDKMPFAEWWGALQKSKSLSQWKTKLVSLGADEAEINKLGMKEIGEFMFSRITEEGSVADKSLQTITIP